MPRLIPALTYDNSKLSSPLAGVSAAELMQRGEAYAKLCGAGQGSGAVVNAFRKGALLAQDPMCFVENRAGAFEDEDRRELRYELDHKWKAQCKMLFCSAFVCSVSAAVQGMDQSVINGANIFFPSKLGIGENTERNEWLDGLIVGAPYFTSCFVSCWLTSPLNKYLGRRGTIFLACAVCCCCSIGQMFVQTWYQLLAARFLLGLGIGPKSGTVPSFSAECAPKQIRGSLVMMWQTWTAFGIMLGYVMGLAFFNLEGTSQYPDLNWRLMLGSACVMPLVVMSMVFFVPESPGWHLKRGEHEKAFKEMRRLRKTDLRAARDMFLAYSLLETEKTIKLGNFFSRCKQLFTVPRNRRAMMASQILMFMQQFCGVNVIAYYSSVIFEEGGFGRQTALLCSFGFGAVNFFFSWPAVFTIDKFGRRSLLLTTFPLMSIFLFWGGFSFGIENAETKIACIATALFAFGAVYSPGEGPVPFTYSAEAYPLYIRDVGMSLATATTWFFNGVLGLTWPAMQRALKPQGGFSFYAVCNLVGWVLVLFFVPETKGKSLEELDDVFEVSTSVQAAYHIKTLVYFWQKLFGMDVERPANPAEQSIDTGSMESKDVVQMDELAPKRKADPVNRV